MQGVRLTRFATMPEKLPRRLTPLSLLRHRVRQYPRATCVKGREGKVKVAWSLVM